MSRYEMMDYDELLRRIGIQPGETWFCGDNPPEELTFDSAGLSYDDARAFYDGRGQDHATLCLSEDINVNGLLLNHRDANGTLWLCTGIEGWWTLPPSEIPEVAKPYWDGNMLTTGRYLARTVTITGCFIPPEPALVWYNRDVLLRSAAIVRGVGLLAMCGNQSPFIGIDSPNFDPPKMAIIQMADVPLVDTLKPNGFTQFSMTFKCHLPTKLSIYENVASIPTANEDGTVYTRNYAAFSLTSAEDTGPTTEYTELIQIAGTSGLRKYTDVKVVNLDSLIADEEITETTPDIDAAYGELDVDDIITLRNEGNYFAFPVFVFNEIQGASTTQKVTVRNLTTNEMMEVQKSVDVGKQLVIDTNLRRVAVVDPNVDSSAWEWDDRSHLTLTSQWITLAPGDNTVLLSKHAAVNIVGNQPQVLWRDTWIG